MRWFWPILAALLLAACSGGVSKDGTVVIAAGSSLTAAARQLEEDGVIESADGFLRYAKLFGGDEPIKPGEYRIEAGMGDAALLKLLQSGKTFQRFIVVPPGMPSILVHERLMAASLLKGSVAVPAEGSVLPDSYAYTRGESRAAVVKRMQDAMTKQLDALWKARKPTTVVRSKEEAVTLASVVEKETAKADERRMVAGVLSNRLRVGERLIRKSDLQDPNPYNTRAITGLPIGPITNPGKEAIAAVLDPAPTRAMFYVADGSGGHAFAETNAQHEANKAKWNALRRERGEM
jgi:UPF0755 protein